MFNKKKIINLILSFLVITTMVGGLLSTPVAAADETVSVTINKRHEVDREGNLPNTGEIMPEFGGEALEGAEFTAYDVTEEYHALLVGSDQETAIAAIQAQYQPTAPEKAVKVGDSVVTDKDGIAQFNGLPVLEDEVAGQTPRHKVYVFVETGTPATPVVTVKSVPMVIALPIYKLMADGTPTDVINTDIQLYPKNTTAVDQKVFTNPGEFAYIDVDGERIFNIKTGDILNFDVNLNVPADIAEQTEYSLTDTPSAGLAYVSDSLTIAGLTEGDDYTVTESTDNGGFKVVFDLTSDNVKAQAGKVLVVSYKMTLTAEVNPEDALTNNANTSVNGNPNDNMDKVVTPGEPEIPVFTTNGHTFIKKDGQTGNALQGAKFILGDGKDNFAELSLNKKGEYVFVKWTTKDLATELVSGADGQIQVIGLTKGDYILQETAAPSEKYVKIEGDIEFTVADGYGDITKLQSVLNHPKGLLPSTGGNGIYGYLAIGAVMMLGSVIWFKRSNKESLEA